MNHYSRTVMMVILVSALLLGGCTWFSKKDQAAGGSPSNPPASGGGTQVTPPEGSQPAASVPREVRDRLARGPVSPDKRWQAAIVPGEGGKADLWVATSDLKHFLRVAEDVHQFAGTAQWTPWNTVLFAVENGLNVDVTWFEADPADGSLEEFLPAWTKGKRALVGPNAFSPDGKRVVFSTGHCLCADPPHEEKFEVYLGHIDGSRVEHLGTNVDAGFFDGELMVVPAGK